jgi:Putative beta-lactamase-inhibitor-like, PepSY-like
MQPSSDPRFLALIGIALTPVLLFPRGASARQQDQMPPRVMEALKARFPQASIRTWAREEEDGRVLYDIEFQQGDRNFEADITEDGTIDNWEKAIAAEDLPAAVMHVVETKYPGATLHEIMEVTNVRDGKDVLEGYEVVLETAAKKRIEITVAPDGKVLEESGEPN